MPNPTITFRLSINQLAHGLKAIRSQSPNFQLTSLNQLVKIIYQDYLTKMAPTQPNVVEQSILDEISMFMHSSVKTKINLDSLVDAEESLISNLSNNAKEN